MALSAVALAILVQFSAISATNPPVRGPLVTPLQIGSLITRACYDCHSNQTKWPWYSHIAPVSWIVAHDVFRGRQELNFSEWSTYYPATRRRKFQWMRRVLQERTMPPTLYILIHRSAHLTNSDRTTLEQWIQHQLNTVPSDRQTH